MKINYIGQSGFIIEENGLRIGIDLWLDNPLNPISIADIPALDYVFLTHDHVDHGREDMIKIAERDGATFVCQTDIAADIVEKKELPEDLILGPNIGGEFLHEDLTITLTPAIHSSNVGVPAGVIVRLPSYKTIYHLGDTAFFSDLKFYGNLYQVDVLLVPIGGFFTMNPEAASFAVEAVSPKIAIPMHYNTFERIAQDPEKFIESVNERAVDTEIRIMKPGSSTDF